MDLPVIGTWSACKDFIANAGYPLVMEQLAIYTCPGNEWLEMQNFDMIR